MKLKNQEDQSAVPFTSIAIQPLKVRSHSFLFFFYLFILRRLLELDCYVKAFSHSNVGC